MPGHPGILGHWSAFFHIDFSFLELCINGIMQCAFLCFWLLSLGLIILRFIHVTCINSSSFTAEWYPIRPLVFQFTWRQILGIFPVWGWSYLRLLETLMNKFLYQHKVLFILRKSLEAKCLLHGAGQCLNSFFKKS